MTEDKAEAIKSEIADVLAKHDLSVEVNTFNVGDDWGVNITTSDPFLLVAIATEVPE